jgi:hypothetical protein
MGCCHSQSEIQKLKTKSFSDTDSSSGPMIQILEFLNSNLSKLPVKPDEKQKKTSSQQYLDAITSILKYNPAEDYFRARRQLKS